MAERFATRRRKRIRLAAAGPGRRCADCGKKIDHRGPKATRCEEHAAVQAAKWRKAYDARPEFVKRRRAYNARPVNIQRARARRNQRMYLLSLCIYALRMEGLTLREAIVKAEAAVRARKGEIPVPAQGRRGEPIGIAALPWKTAKGRNRGRFGRKKAR